MKQFTADELRDLLDALYIAQADLPHTHPQLLAEGMSERLGYLIERFRAELADAAASTTDA